MSGLRRLILFFIDKCNYLIKKMSNFNKELKFCDMNLRKIGLSLLGAAAVIPASAQIFYKIEGNGLEKPSYLFGTHHLAPISVVEENNVPEYFEETRQVVGEIDLTLDPMTIAMAMQSHMMAPPDSTLSKIISPEDYVIINEEFKKYTPIPGTDLSMFETMKPMVVSTLVTVSVMSEKMGGFDAENQLDSYFMKKAKEEGKKVTPLETPEFQASVLYDSTPISYQAEGLVEILKNPQQIFESSEKLNEAYFNGDLETMYSLSEEEDSHPEFMVALLDRRNADWLTKLPSIMEDSPAFIAVGALHLAGDKGLVKGLRDLGYTVTPLP